MPLPQRPPDHGAIPRFSRQRQYLFWPWAADPQPSALDPLDQIDASASKLVLLQRVKSTDRLTLVSGYEGKHRRPPSVKRVQSAHGWPPLPSAPAGRVRFACALQMGGVGDFFLDLSNLILWLYSSNDVSRSGARHCIVVMLKFARFVERMRAELEE